MAESALELCKKIRRDIINASYEAKACHIGSALSCVEIIAVLHSEILKEGDFFVFSKASGVAAYYSILAEKYGFNLADKLRNYPLPSTEVPGIIHSMGSMGHGLPIAVGLAYANRNKRVYCLMSDGEIAEGTTWESLLFASHHNLKNLTIIIDRNFIQACGKTEDVLKLGNLEAKCKSFGCGTICVDGHSIEVLKLVLETSNTIPRVVIAETVKGKGVDFMENKVEWHYRNLDEKLLVQCQI